MSIPTKPWEATGAGPMSRSSISFGSGERLHSSAVPYPGSGGGSIGPVALPSTSTSPPVPPRPGQTRPLGVGATGSMYGRSMYSPYSSYSSPYMGGMGVGASSMYSPYGMSSYGMGSYGGGYGGYYGNRMGMYGGYGSNPVGPEGQLTFSQLAEESSASAFQSIESFVSAFGSISAMLESTFHAVYSSFRAVVGVADHMGRLKQILSAMAVFRFFRWVFKRFLYLIGISKIKPEDVESLWTAVSGMPAQQDGSEWEKELYPEAKGSSWPILMFLGFILAGPYLMWKLISRLNLNANNTEGARAWATGQSEHFVAVAEHDFEGMADRELRMRVGQKIRLAPASSQPPNVRGWVLASDGTKVGLVPTNYIKILGKRVGGSLDNNEFATTKAAVPSFSISSNQPVTAVASQPSVVIPPPPPMPSSQPRGSVTSASASSQNPNVVVTPPIEEKENEEG